MIKISYKDNKKKHIEAVTVCVDYSDYLNYFIKYNLKHFDKLIIVTTKKDKKTIEICEKNNMQYVFTDRLYENNAPFNKGKAINDGLKYTTKKDWILLIDSDIILPSDFRKKVNETRLNEDILYGIFRHDCRDTEGWKEYKKMSKKQKNTLLKRFMNTRKGKYKKIVGYFQLFHSSSKKINKKMIYPENSDRANASDRLFYRRWEYYERAFLEDIQAIHLSHSEMGINWEGRKDYSFDF